MNNVIHHDLLPIFNLICVGIRVYYIKAQTQTIVYD